MKKRNLKSELLLKKVTISKVLQSKIVGGAMTTQDIPCQPFTGQMPK